MAPEEQNAAIWYAFLDDDYLHQEPELKQDLGKYSLVQPKNTTLSHNATELIDAYS